jgi:hypothetical protein
MVLASSEMTRLRKDEKALFPSKGNQISSSSSKKLAPVGKLQDVSPLTHLERNLPRTIGILGLGQLRCRLFGHLGLDPSYGYGSIRLQTQDDLLEKALSHDLLEEDHRELIEKTLDFRGSFLAMPPLTPKLLKLSVDPSAPRLVETVF